MAYVCVCVCVFLLNWRKLPLLWIRRTLLVEQLVEALLYKPEGRGFDSWWCHWIFSLTYSFRPPYGPGVDSASNRNEYQEYFLGVKTASTLGWQPYHHHVPIVLKTALIMNSGHSAGGAVGWGTALQAGMSRVWSPMVSLDFFTDIILSATLWPWGWLSL